MSTSVAARRGRPGNDRDQVLHAATALFLEQGYDATSVSDIAARLGVTKSALYHHFASKSELLAVPLDTALTALEQVADQAELRHASASEQLRDIVRGAVLVLIDNLSAVTLLLRVRGNSDVELDALERRRAFDHRVTGIVAAAQTEGYLRTDVDAAVATRLIFGMVNSLTEWYRPDGPLDAAELSEEILRVGLEGLRRTT